MMEKEPEDKLLLHTKSSESVARIMNVRRQKTRPRKKVNTCRAFWKTQGGGRILSAQRSFLRVALTNHSAFSQKQTLTD